MSFCSDRSSQGRKTRISFPACSAGRVLCSSCKVLLESARRGLTPGGGCRNSTLTVVSPGTMVWPREGAESQDTESFPVMKLCVVLNSPFSGGIQGLRD